MAEKKKVQTHLTPAGIAQYPRLSKPDVKFKPEGEYKVTLVLPATEAAPLIKLIDAAMVESLAKAKAENPTKAKQIKAATDKPYKPVVDGEGNETDSFKFNFKMAAVITARTGEKFNKRPNLFDGKGQPLDPAKVSIGGGSKVKVAFELYPFYTPLVGAGVSLRLHAVQVITLVEYSGGRDAAGYGFAVEEDGFDATETAETAVPVTDGAEAPAADAKSGEEF